ncbi:hypothetical protein D3C73_1427280 [compost metagenome]
MNDIVTGVLENARQPTGELVKHEQRAEERGPQQQGPHCAAFGEQMGHWRPRLRWALVIEDRYASPAFASDTLNHLAQASGMFRAGGHKAH